LFNTLMDTLKELRLERRSGSHQVPLERARSGKLTIVTDVAMLLDHDGLIDPKVLRTVLRKYERRAGTMAELVIMCPDSSMLDELPMLEMGFQRVADENRFSVVIQVNPVTGTSAYDDGVIITPGHLTSHERELELELLRYHTEMTTPPLRVIAVDRNWIHEIAGTEHGLVQRLIGRPMGKLRGANTIEIVLDRGVAFAGPEGMATYQYTVVHRPGRLPTAYRSYDQHRN
jgi:hypothetical protein